MTTRSSDRSMDVIVTCPGGVRIRLLNGTTHAVYDNGDIALVPADGQSAAMIEIIQEGNGDVF